MEQEIYDRIYRSLLRDDWESALKLVNNIKGKEYEDIFYLQMIPYFSFLCKGILEFCESNNLVGIIIDDKNTEKIMANMRVKIKLYSEKKTRPIKSAKELEKIHFLFHEYFKKKNYSSNNILMLLIPVKFPDFGTYSISDKFIGNIYLNYWYINEILSIEEIGIEKGKENIKLFSEGVGRILAAIKQEDINTFKNPIINIIEKDFSLKDNNTNIFNDKYDKYISLLLFNILCSINFIIYFLCKILPEDNKFCFRIKFICYYSSISSLVKLINKAENDKKINIGIENYHEKIKYLEELKTSLGEYSKLRNCIFHYKVRKEDIDIKEILPSEPFYGLIEKYTGENFYSFSKKIDKNLNEISLMLEKWILDNENSK